MNCAIYKAKSRALISLAVTAQLICAFVFAYAKIRFAHVVAHIRLIHNNVHIQIHSETTVHGRIAPMLYNHYMLKSNKEFIILVHCCHFININEQDK